MISALLYLQFQSAKNRLASRLKRLKQPKYLAGAIVGGLYFYFYFFRWMFHARTRGFNMAASWPGDPLLYESFGALALLVIILIAWLVPHQRAALIFSEAEIAFLFPAPIHRRSLIHFKLLRSQGRILFSVLFLILISSRFGFSGRTLIHALGWWLALSTLNLHLLGCSFTRTLLLDRGLSNWQRRLGVLALVAAGLGFVVIWTVRSMPPFAASQPVDLNAWADYARQVLVSGPAPYLLYPFRLMVRPFFATGPMEFLIAVGPALLLLVAHYWWVVLSDVAFEEASVEASQKIAERINAAKAGPWRVAGRETRGQRPPFQLAATGPPSIALLWKNLIAAGQAFTLRTWFIMAAVAVMISIGLQGRAGASTWRPLVGITTAMFAAWAVLIGPQMVRQDLRQDLPLADILKTYPLRGWQVALGEILAPAVILTGVQALLLMISVGVFSQVHNGPISGSLVVVIGLGAAIQLPMLNVISLLIPNAAVLLFPAWFLGGKDAPQGVEATGQRLIFAFGQLLAFVIALLPSVGVFAVFFFLAKFVTGVPAAVLVASVASAAGLAVEAGLGVMFLGWLFERFDSSAEPAP